MTSTVFTRGAEWSEATLSDGWGETTTDEQAEALGALVVEQFEQLAHATGSTVFWQPATSEVIGTVIGTGGDMWREARDDGGETTDADMEQWREAAFAAVWACVVDESDDADLCAKVAEALRLAYCVGCGETFDPAAGPWKESGDGDLCQECTKTWEAESNAEIKLQALDD